MSDSYLSLFYFVHPNSSTSTFTFISEKILDLLNLAIDHPCLDPNEVNQIFSESERLATLTSIVHQSDVILRKLVGKWVEVLKGGWIPHFSMGRVLNF